MRDIPGARPARHHPQPAPLRTALAPLRYSTRIPKTCTEDDVVEAVDLLA